MKKKTSYKRVGWMPYGVEGKEDPWVRWTETTKESAADNFRSVFGVRHQGVKIIPVYIKVPDEKEK